MSDAKSASGGCMCGAVRYEVIGEPVSVIHCHCKSCRRHSGAAVVSLVGLKKDQVRFSGTKRRIYESSPGVGRAFCGECGTSLTWEGDGEELGPLIELLIGTLDDPAEFVPTCHVHYDERVAWFDVADELPRYHEWEEGEPCSRGPVAGGGAQTGS